MSKVFIIAEIGVNHNGNEILLKKLIEEAAKCGVDACKFQTFKADTLALTNTPKVKYQESTSDKGESHWEMLKRLEMTHDMHLIAMEECRNLGVEFISTPYDPESVKYLFDLGVEKVKTASADVVDHRIHLEIIKHEMEPYIALGMANQSEILQLLSLYSTANKPPTILHCVSNYPCSDKSLNLNCITTMQQDYGLKVGFSDHSVGSEAAAAAVALGAKVVEKHFTLDVNLPGPDHKASSIPSEFKELVARIRRVETMLGNGIKTPQDEEMSMKSISRKSAIAAQQIKAGQIITENNLTMRRPGNGISGQQYYDLLGKRVIRNIEKNEIISWDAIENDD